MRDNFSHVCHANAVEAKGRFKTIYTNIRGEGLHYI